MKIKQIILDIEGLGIILYSDFAVKHIEDDEDYLSESYDTPQQVAKHVNKGTIVGFCTGSPGTYILDIHNGYPSNQEIRISDLKLQLGIEVRDNRICFKDLYDLMEWDSESDVEFVEVENGYYLVTLCGNIPMSGIAGDEQFINVYLTKVQTMPEVHYEAVPMFCKGY
ncbi:hypothetical protein [Clostridium butyricum]|uniref:hypothetical protein n=1 Tax=Clostridium butyricum TaxID=1492 RepID=UPI00374FB919